MIIGFSTHTGKVRRLFSDDDDGRVTVKETEHINAYLVSGPHIVVEGASRPSGEKSPMVWGNKPTDGGYLSLSTSERTELLAQHPQAEKYVRPYCGAAELIRGLERFCIWVEDADASAAGSIPALRARFEKVRDFRASSKAAETRPAAHFPHRFRQIQSVASQYALIMPQVSSERREYLPIGLLPERSIVSNLAFAFYDAPLWNMALIASRIHLVWIATVCGKLETRYRYSNTLGWNTFPVPTLTDKNKADLTRCAEDILLAREAHFPATIADLYDPDEMPDDLRAAHERNDEILERIYIGRHFKNDTERLEKLFDLYSKMIAAEGGKAAKGKATKKAKAIS
ncbi:MAG TPA: type IIL restriction-modification enzyme MmeI [Roseiarcus sp.]|nr:type IIL restriction-modification enzyme MmeI [Roseiarcus sp.]